MAAKKKAKRIVPKKSTKKPKVAEPTKGKIDRPGVRPYTTSEEAILNALRDAHAAATQLDDPEMLEFLEAVEGAVKPVLMGRATAEAFALLAKDLGQPLLASQDGNREFLSSAQAWVKSFQARRASRYTGQVEADPCDLARAMGLASLWAMNVGGNPIEVVVDPETLPSSFEASSIDERKKLLVRHTWWTGDAEALASACYEVMSPMKDALKLRLADDFIQKAAAAISATRHRDPQSDVSSYVAAVLKVAKVTRPDSWVRAISDW